LSKIQELNAILDKSNLEEICALETIIKERKIKMQETAKLSWEKVVEAMSDYMKEFGEIRVCIRNECEGESFYLDKTARFLNLPGTIEMPY
jgi:hypothetical protein